MNNIYVCNIIDMYNKKFQPKYINTPNIILRAVSSSLQSSLLITPTQTQISHNKSLFSTQKSAKIKNGFLLEQEIQFSIQNPQLQDLPLIKCRTISEDNQKNNTNLKLNAQRQKFNRIKAKQLQLKKKAESILSNSSSSSSPFKRKHQHFALDALMDQNNVASISPSKKGIYLSSNFDWSSKHSIKIKNNSSIQIFQVIKYINEGCFGKVYLVKHEVTNLICCLKMIDRNFLDQNGFNQLIREIKLQSFANHPNIVNLYQFFVDANYVYLLLQPCLGGNLYQMISKSKKNCLQEKQTIKFVKQVAKAIQYLHKNSIIHRDIKPENILVHQNSAKLCDFGWAVHSPLMRDTQCGTPLYACPQIIKNQCYDSKIDIWCIGVLAFELLYGEPPFKIRNINDMAKIVNEEVNFATDLNISESAVQFIQGCLQKKAVRRFVIRQVLQHSFLLHTRASDKFRNTIS